MAAAAMKTVACMAVLCVLVMGPSAEAAITCGGIVSKLSPCLPYATHKAPALPPACCSAISSIKAAASTTADRQAACSCLKSVAGKYAGLDLGLVSSIPGKCNVNIGYPLSTTVDCTMVQ